MIDSDEQSHWRDSLREQREPPKSPSSHEYGRFLSIGLPALEVPVAA